MKIAALSNKDAWFSRIAEELDKGGLSGQTLKGVPTEDTVLVDTAILEHDGPDTCYRPYIALTGRILESVPAVELPYGVKALTFGSAPGTPVAYRYDLTDEQIARLVTDKGLHSGSFTLPEALTGIEWQLPGTIDAFVASPTSFDDPPVVFVELNEATSRRIDEASSGYELVNYVPDLDSQVALEAPQVDGPERGTLDQDLFADDVLPEYEAPKTAPAVEDEPQVDEGKSAFAQLLEDASRRVRAKAEAEMVAEAVERDRLRAEVDPDGSESVYRSRIQPSLEAAALEKPEDYDSGEVSEDAEQVLVDSAEDNEDAAATRRGKHRAVRAQAERIVEQETEEGFIAFD